MELTKWLPTILKLLCILCPFYSLCIAKQSTSSLQLVNIYFRHGDRVPERSYPKDPYNNVSIWYPDTWGALTKRGKQRTFALGQFLRKSYNDLLNEYYLPGEVIMKSSSNDRCLMSAEMVLAGLYPPEKKQLWNSTIDWQPIPVHTDAFITDPRLGACPKFLQLLADIDNLPAVKQFDENNSELYAFLSKESGINVTKLLEAVLLYDILRTEDENGLKLPAWTSNYYPGTLRGFLEFENKVFADNQDIKRLGAGTIIYQLIQDMMQKREGNLSPDFKVILHSTHDVFITFILGILGVEPILPVGYAEALIFELHKTEAQYEVKLLHVKDAFTGKTELVDLPACASPCTLEKFQKAFQHIALSPQDREKECHRQNMKIKMSGLPFGEQEHIVIL